ncbi:transposase [Cucumis melo var. makuwa]|uniref:Transposase n=1 Tax=Cucumis melo var. makuwa TaxID=1194695 RepID=A0A5A7VHJ5_CUCMM|nr:transposase [Cucumis melo var. makuwa]
MIEVSHEKYSKDPNGFEKLLIDAEKSLYEGCKKYTKLSTLVKLYNLKVRYGWSDISFSELLKTLKEILPTTNELPNSLYEAKKTLGALGMEYEKIHACPNNCCLYRKEFANATECPECGQSRWKNVKDRNEERKQIPSKVIWYFPPIPRFKRLFKSIECAENLTWHASERIEDGKLRHPADSPAWKLVDFKWPDFGSEPRNLRLALSADGVNPHGDMSSKYSCWPIVMVIYNLPPWLCMKRKYMMLSMLISRPKQPGDDIGTYLAPLIEDLKLLWENGVECYDAYREEVFNLRSVLLWTINDFPAYGNLSGCCVKGSVLPKHVRYAITRLCIVFNSVCNKVLDAQQLDKLEEDVVVSTELEVGNSGVSDNLRWIAHGPHPFVITYSGYAINGCRYHTKSFEKDRSVQNSGNSGGVRIDELSYTLVDLNRVGHKSDSFILASQTKQVFYVEDPSDVRWSVVLTPPQRDFEDRYNDDELGDTILRCEGIPNDMPDVYLNNDLDENVSTYVVRYNEDGAPIGENGAKLKSFIGSATHYHVPITYMSWKSVPAELKDKIFTTVVAAFVIDPRSRQNVLQTAGISFRQFKNWLTTKYIIPHKDEPQLLQVPPEKYSFIEQNHWEEFVRSRLSKTFQGKRKLQQDRRSKNKYNHRISRKGYANLKEEMYVFVDPSLISSGNTQESRIRNLCSRLMVSKPDQVVLAPFNPGGHWALLAINAYEDTVFYLDSLRTTSKATTRYVTDTAIAIFHSQKNINKSRKQTLWRTCPLQVGSTTCGYYVMKYIREIVNRGSIAISDSIDIRKSYSQAELDEVRIELVEFLGSYI